MNALVSQAEGRALAPASFDEMERASQVIAQAGIFGVKNQAQALALMLVSQAEGSHYATVATDYDIIQGKATRKTHSVLARFQAMGGKVEWHELTHTRAEATFSHPQGGALRLDWTIEQAKQAKLTGKDNWHGYARAMLRARLIAEGVRAVYPAAIGGFQVPEEAASPQLDGPPPPPTTKHMGAADIVQPPAEAPPPSPAPESKLPPFPDADFERGLPVWKKAAAKLPVAEVLARAEAANPGCAFTDQQKAKILSLKKDEPVVTFAQVADAIAKAKDADALNTARDLTRQVAEDQQRKELDALANEREAALTVEG